MTRLITVIAAVLAAALYLLPARTVLATEEHARQTGLECGVCHMDPAGGGPLTARGEEFMKARPAKHAPTPLSLPRRIVRLLVGYLHILAGVVWFGAIFYVHILLKPAYAAKGLPKGELILGWAGILVVGVTGSLLTFTRMPSFEAFYSTRFGVLLSIKIFFYLLMASSAALVTFVLGPRMKRKIIASRKEGGTFTARELQSFDGKEGRKALVGYDGQVYDVTGSRMWREGKHARHLAGEDLTAALKGAPHGPEKLDNFPKAGWLASGAQPAVPDRPKAFFYVFAYMNLVMVFLVLAVIALWRWW